MTAPPDEARERDRLAEAIADRMDGPVTVLGVLFLFVVLAGTVTAPGGALSRVLDVAGWVLWAVFAVEFAVRAAIAESKARFLRRNWWQLVFLALPFLRFVRVLGRLRLARVGRVVSSAVRSGRTAGSRLSGRLAWLLALTGIVVLAASQLLHELVGYGSYGDALHATALATITGEPLGRPEPLARVLEVVLAAYSVVVFATIAGAFGAYFLERRDPGHTERPPDLTAAPPRRPQRC